MTNSEAIDILKERIELSNEMLTKPFFQDAQETIKKTIEAYKVAIEALEYDWIPVTETKRLPEEETDVLVCNANGDIEISSGSYSTEVKDFIWYTSGWRFGKVIAWMPKPKPYAAESEK